MLKNGYEAQSEIDNYFEEDGGVENGKYDHGKYDQGKKPFNHGQNERFDENSPY